jgi:chemotaxis protein MotB
MIVRRRRTEQAPVSHERWMVSYADFVTLLFAFFVVMFSTANEDKDKARAMSLAVSAALSGHEKPHAFSMAHIISPTNKSLTSELMLNDPDASKGLQASLIMLQEQLHDEIERGQIELHMESRGLTVSFKQAAVFDSGEALVKPSAVPAIAKVANAILKVNNEIRLEGHTDNLPIHNERFNNNWELSSARSIAMLQILTEKMKVPVHRLAVSGYADVLPIASNDTEAGRARNRRVDVVILSSLAASREAGK